MLLRYAGQGKRESHLLPERCCREARVKERGTPSLVHKGDKHDHGQAACGRSTSREASQQARGHLADEKWLTARSSAPRRCRQRLYLPYMPPCSRRRKPTVGRDVLRHCISRQVYKSLYTIYQTCLSTPVLPSAPSLLYGLAAAAVRKPMVRVRQLHEAPKKRLSQESASSFEKVMVQALTWKPRPLQ